MQPLHDALPGDRDPVNRTFLSIVSNPKFSAIDAVLGHREGARRDIRRIASTLFCSAEVDPSIVTFAKHRTAQHWGLAEDAVDVLITARLLDKAARLMTDQHIRAADQPAPTATPLVTAA